MERDKNAFSFKPGDRSTEILIVAIPRLSEGGSEMPGDQHIGDPLSATQLHGIPASPYGDILPSREGRAKRKFASAPAPAPPEPVAAAVAPAPQTEPSHAEPVPAPAYQAARSAAPTYPATPFPTPAYPPPANAGATYPGYAAPPAHTFAQPAFAQTPFTQTPIAHPAFSQPVFPQQGGFAGTPAYPAPPRSTGQKIGIIVGVSVACVIGIAVLAAIAIPVFLSQQKPKSVTLTLPASLEGSTQLTTGAAQEAASAMNTEFGNATAGYTTDLNSAVYKGSTSFLIMTAKLTRHTTQADRNAFVTNFAKGAAGQSAVTMAKVPPGPLGGSTKCGLATPTSAVPAVLCVSIDDSAIVFVAVYTDDLVAGTMLATELRGDVEHK